jgi:hypothetical protein
MRFAAKGLGVAMLVALYAAIMWRVFGANPAPVQPVNAEILAPIPHVFVNGEVADADQVNENFQHLIDFASGLETLATALTGRVSALENQTTSLQTQQGTTLTRWGNATAPAGTTLVYSGYGYANWDVQTGGNLPMVVQTGDPGATATHTEGNLVPMGTAEDASQPGGIAHAAYIKAAVILVNGPATVIWGTQTAPTGWSVIYPGYAFGPLTNLQNIGPLCIDSGDFDASGGYFGSTNGTRLYPLEINQGLAAPGDDALKGKWVKCAAIRKS